MERLYEPVNVELLEALKEIVSYENRGRAKGEPRIAEKYFNLAQSAIAKAEGKEKLEPLTIEEFVNIREAMYSVAYSPSSASAMQANEFFKAEGNLDRVKEKLSKLLTYKG